MRIPVYGLFATAGIIAALALSQRAARRAGLSPDHTWDAGVFAIAAAFIASRLLLVLGNLHAFWQMPLLVLTLPSLTYVGVLLTAVFTWFYLLLKRIPVLATLDAWSPSAALLAGFLQLGHFFEGTDAGMPTRLPWSVRTPGDTILGRVHPVQLYAIVPAAVLGWLLYRWLPQRSYAGEVAARALFLGGAASFLLDMLRQPYDSYSTLPLDASQFVALGAMLVGMVLYATQRPKRAQTKTQEVR
jgi:phosphatidylglycerol:prolipoprotein diacylglycerol transferase